jgi:broad specificity phosphatase PhoE
MLTRAFVGALLSALVISGPATAQVATGAGEGPDGSAVMYLVRHAEKALENPTDPALTPAGEERAVELARVLMDAGITRVYSTATLRTRSTAMPVAEQGGLPIESYDAGSAAAIEAFARQLLNSSGRTLVVGHSNTTPELVRALGGDPVAPMTDVDYDRLYIVVRGPDGAVTSSMLHFGAPAGGG